MHAATCDRCRPGRWALIPLAVVAGLVASDAHPQAPGQAASGDVTERARVVARDLYLLPRRAPLEASEVAVDVAGAPARVVGVAPVVDGAHHVVLYFDTVLGETRDLRHGARVLASAAQGLAALGQVTVVLADSESAEARLVASRDPGRIDSFLSSLSLEIRGQARLSSARVERLLEEPPPDPTELSALRRSERDTIAGRIDFLLATLSSRPWPEGPRLLVPVGLVYAPNASADSASDTASDLVAGTEADNGPAPEEAARDGDPCALASRQPAALGSVLGAMGWSLLALSMPLPERDPIWRFGKLDVLGPGDMNVPSLRIAFHEDRKPKRGRAFLALAHSHLGAGDSEAAEDALRDAIHHFDNGKKTLAEETEAWTLFAGLLARSERGGAAGRALVRAARLESRLEDDEEAPRRARPFAPRSYDSGLVAAWARESGGASSSSLEGEDLATLLGDLGERWRITLQLPWPLPGDLAPVKVEVQGREGDKLDRPPARWTSGHRPGRALLALARLGLDGGGLEVWAGGDVADDENRVLTVSGLAPRADSSLVPEWRALHFACRGQLQGTPIEVVSAEVDRDRARLQLEPLPRAGTTQWLLIEELDTGRFAVVELAADP